MSMPPPTSELETSVERWSQKFSNKKCGLALIILLLLGILLALITFILIKSSKGLYSNQWSISAYIFESMISQNSRKKEESIRLYFLFDFALIWCYQNIISAFYCLNRIVSISWLIQFDFSNNFLPYDLWTKQAGPSIYKFDAVCFSSIKFLFLIFLRTKLALSSCQ